MAFTFVENKDRVFRSTEGYKSVDLDVNERIAVSLDTNGDIPSAITHMMPDLIRKWGLSGMQLKSFRFDSVRDAGSALPIFHQGMSQELINNFFNDASVASTLQLPLRSGKVSTFQTAYNALSNGVEGVVVDVLTEPLKCSATSLSILNRLLHCKRLIRNPPPMPTGDESSTTDVNKTFKYPTIRQMDVYLPCGVTIADALREYVMLHDDQHSENVVRMLDEELAGNGDAPEEDDNLGDDRNYPLLSEAQRKEFLYHVFWRLVSGGSPICQYEEEAIYYKLGARELYKDIVSVGRRKAVEGNARPDLVLQSHVYAVKGIRVGPSGKDLEIFPVSDDAFPSNGNFAYIIINPTRREIVWWYNAFSSSF